MPYRLQANAKPPSGSFRPCATRGNLRLNDIDSRQRELDRGLGRAKGVAVEMLRREMAHAIMTPFSLLKTELTKLRGEALALIKPFLKRLVASSMRP